MSLDKVCLIPWVSVSTHPAGFVSRCMMSTEPMGTMSDPGVWDNNNFIKLRKDMVAGTWNLPGCKTCHDREEQGLVSQRLNWKTNERWWNGDLWDTIDFKESLTGNKIFHLFLNTNNLCNFKCRMCNSTYSNSWILDDQLLIQNGIKRHAHFDNVKNRNNLIEFITLQKDKLSDVRLITVTGGEPFINNDLLDALSLLDLSNVHLSITTNGSLLTEEHLVKLSSAKKVNINISIDGTGKLFEYMRSDNQCTWQTINSKISMLRNFAKEHNNFVFSPNASFQLYNMLNIAEFYDWAEQLIVRPHEWIEFRLLSHPQYLNVAIAPDAIKDSCMQQINYVEQTYPANKYFLDNMKRALNIKLSERDKLWSEFQKFTTVLDSKRSQNIENVCPELYEYFTV